jgi:large subunit ribosomal protein L29
MKSSEIKELTTKELVEKIDTEKTQLTRLKLNHAVSPLDNPLKITETRKNIARLKTELRKRELNENSNS